ncbi:DUF202 domain-containing protein [Corynebacterium cystitidis]|uniref:DUF202 domain-containing protein n=1 Tax=Corynebacterium cystitidis TaxID=35757 RepID=UPI00211E8B47|nr:DUF202 domain-containing protein [Corynebacterium cystitidis]
MRFAKEFPTRVKDSQIPITDLGLQPERTSLSWSRTSLAMLVCSATLLRWAWHYTAVVYVAIGLLMVLALLIVLTQRRRYSVEAQGIQREFTEPNVFAVFTMTIAMVLLGAIGLYLIGVTF